MTTKILKESPEIPYRAHSEDERKSLRDFARTIRSTDVRQKFWNKTIPLAQERISLLEGMGYFVHNPEDYGYEQRGIKTYGELFVSTNDPKDVDYSKDIDISGRLGNILTWKEGGFELEPLQMSYLPKKGGIEQIKAALKLRERLVDEEIPFTDRVDLSELKERIDFLNSELGASQYLTSILGGKTLR